MSLEIRKKLWQKGNTPEGKRPPLRAMSEKVSNHSGYSWALTMTGMTKVADNTFSYRPAQRKLMSIVG